MEVEDSSTWSPEEWDKFREQNLAGYLKWYVKTGVTFLWLGRSCSILAGLFGVAATILAAAPLKELGFEDRGLTIAKWIIVCLTALTTAFTAAYSRFAHVARTREAGRVAVTEIEQQLKMMLRYQPMSEQERAQTLAAWPTALAAVERQYGHVMDAAGSDHRQQIPLPPSRGGLSLGDR